MANYKNRSNQKIEHLCSPFITSDIVRKVTPEKHVTGAQMGYSVIIQKYRKGGGKKNVQNILYQLVWIICAPVLPCTARRSMRL